MKTFSDYACAKASELKRHSFLFSGSLKTSGCDVFSLLNSELILEEKRSANNLFTSDTEVEMFHCFRLDIRFSQTTSFRWKIGFRVESKENPVDRSSW